jgi:hypothetical protein
MKKSDYLATQLPRRSEYKAFVLNRSFRHFYQLFSQIPKKKNKRFIYMTSVASSALRAEIIDYNTTVAKYTFP